MHAGRGGATLEATHIRLRRLAPADAPALAALVGDWEVARMTARIPHPYDEGMAAAFITEAAARAAAGTEHVWAIERLVDRRLVGGVGFRWRDGAPEVGYWVGRPFWGQGYATEAVRRLLDWLFADAGGERVLSETLSENRASARVLEKSGFADAGPGTGREGRLAGRPVRRFAIERATWSARHAARPRVLVAAVALIDVDGRVLLQRRPAGKSMAGLWEFPGGKVLEGETPESALVRELHEELGIDITESCLAPLTFASHAYTDFHLLMPLYVCRTWKGQVVAREGQALKWARPQAMAALPMPPADAPLIPLLREFL